MIDFIMYLLVLVAFIVFLFWLVLKQRNANIWVLSYLSELMKSKSLNNDVTHVYFCLADHYEPYFSDASDEVARGRVKRWIKGYREVSNKHTDSDGRHPQHSYFYPEEEYDEWILNELQNICGDDLGDVDIHLHHDNDTAANLTKTINGFKQLLFDKHGLLRKDDKGNIVYGFIHGNWALDNSRPDGRWCGVNNELEVLINTGCLFDMTMPSAPSDTQTKIINSIYLAKETGVCKSHDTGEILKVGKQQKEDELLMIQGPLTFNWKARKLGLIPKIESSELSYDAPPNEQRVKLWEKCQVSVEGAENHIFIKTHTHGLEDQNCDMFFDLGGFESLWSSLEKLFKQNKSYRLHYVTAWEMYSKIRSLSTSEIS